MTHTIYGWLASGDWKPNFDGAATLFAAFVAILAAMVAYWAVTRQIKANRENLQKQIDVEKQAREEDLREQRVATALLILADLNCIYLSVKNLESLHTINPGNVKPLPLFKSIPSHWSTVYEANCAKLGDLDRSVVQAVAVCYSQGQYFVARLRDYEESAERVHRNEDIFNQDIVARELLTSLKSMLKDLRLAMFLASWQLCNAAGVPFRAPDVPIANENEILARLDTEHPALSLQVRKAMEDAQTH